MFIADTGVEYRFVWCPHCRSVRYHSVRRLAIKKFGNVWWVNAKTECFGIAPIIVNKRRRWETECGYVMLRWMQASQWNALIKQDSYAA